MTIFIILSNICSGISISLLMLSSRCKTETAMLRFQIFDVSFATLSNVFVLGYGGVISGLVGLVRNILVYKKVTIKHLPVILVSATIIVGTINFIFTEHTWYALFPIIASASYTAALCMKISYKMVKYALILNLVLWSIYGLCTKNYISTIGCVIVIFNAVSTMHKIEEEHIITECD